MSDGAISVESVSAQKTQQVAQQAQVAVFKKQLDQQGDVQKQLIDSAAPRALSEGVGTKLNTIA